MKYLLHTIIFSGLFFIFSLSYGCERRDSDSPDFVWKNELCDDDIKGKKFPKFEEFRVEEPAPGKSHPLNFNSLPETRYWRTVISEGYKRGVNFAGHFVISSWGCGTGCLQSAVIDTKTGNIFRPSEIALVISNGTKFTKSGFKKLGIEDDAHLHFMSDSNLLVVVGKFGESAKKVGVYYFRWDGRKMNLLSKIERDDP